MRWDRDTEKGREWARNYAREYRRKRVAEDPEYRAKMIEYKRQWLADVYADPVALAAYLEKRRAGDKRRRSRERARRRREREGQ